MADRDWALGDIVWALLGLAVVLGLIALNAYVQRLARIEDERQLRLPISDPLSRHRSVASQSRLSDDI